MAEDKKKAGPAAGKDLASKIATAYRNLPPEQRTNPGQDSNDIQNPELDQAFDKMVEMYKVRRPERENSVVAFPVPPTVRAPKPESGPGEEYECPECGHTNPAENQFCGMCGAAREEEAAAPPSTVTQGVEQNSASLAAESGIKHHHHYYHHHHYRNNPYLLLAVVLLLGVIAWQQWREYQRGEAAPTPAPIIRVQPPQPAQASPNPSANPASPAAVPSPDPSSKPAKKPAGRPTGPRSSERPVQQGQPPGPQVRVPRASPAAAPPLAPYESLTDQRIPALQSFPSSPPKPEAGK